MKSRTKMWLLIGGFFTWLLVAGFVRDHYDREFAKCEDLRERTGNYERWEDCLDKAGVTRHGSPKRGLGQFILLGR